MVVMEEVAMGEVAAGKVQLSRIGAQYVTRVDAADCWEVQLQEWDQRDLLELTRQALASHPGWVDMLMRLRNGLVKPFGLKTSDVSMDVQEPRFPLLAESSEEVVLGTDDKHLSFWVSSRIIKDDREDAPKRFSMTTYVRINNTFGRLYWGIVQYFHPLIVRAGLRKI